MSIQWENPPARGRRKTKWGTTFAELRANPNKWARLYLGLDRNAHSLAGRLRKNYGDEFTIISRTIDELGPKGEKQAGVWAIYEVAAKPPTREDLLTQG
jgi:hypothetical protein